MSDKLETVHEKIRTLHKQLGEARTNTCDHAVDHALRAVNNALELFFPEAFGKTPSELADELLKKMRPPPQATPGGFTQPTHTKWQEFLVRVRVLVEAEYREAHVSYRKDGDVMRFYHAIFDQWIFNQMWNGVGEFQNIEARFEREMEK